ncbi:hypothetical protein FS749_007469 [Ceratobasidium sp. UAMH 11750]|nr:hypothetical protein FS749_007469 [Ceratobasidium sp. UAMH 11750]
MVFTCELSAVSLPTRERAAAKAKHRVSKQGQPAAPVTTQTKRTRRAVAPTLASTRQPRRSRTELTYTNKEGELVVNSVNRRDNEEPNNQDVPFLPGQEDLQHKDDEGSMTEPEDISPGMQALLGYSVMGPGDVGFDMEHEDGTEDRDDMEDDDDDAEGEDDIGFNGANLGNTPMVAFTRLPDDLAVTSSFNTPLGFGTGFGMASGFGTASGFGMASGFGTASSFAGTSNFSATSNNLDATFVETNKGPFGYSQAPGGMDFTGGIDPDELQALFGGLNQFNLNDSASGDSFLPSTSTPSSHFQNFGAMLRDAAPPMHDHPPATTQPTGELNHGLTDTPMDYLTDLPSHSDIATPLGSAGAPALSLHSSLRNCTPGLGQGSSSPYGATQPLPPASPLLPAHRALSRGGTPCPPNRPRPLATTRGESPILSRSCAGTPRFSRHSLLGAPTRGNTQALVLAIRNNSRTSAPQSGAPSPTISVSNPTSPRRAASQAPGTPASFTTTPLRHSNSLPDLTSINTQELTEQDLDPLGADSEPSTSANNSAYTVGQTVPAVQDIKRKVIEHYKLTSRNRRDRHIPTDTPLLANGLPRVRSLQEEEKKFRMLIEYFLLYQMVNTQAWLTDPAATLDKAMEYGEELMGKPRQDIIVTAGFEALVLSKLSNLRSDALRNVCNTVSRALDVYSGDEEKTTMLMTSDIFIYRDLNKTRDQMFRADVILELCTRDSPSERAFLESLYGNIRDRTATQGLPVAAIAFAATMVYFVLDKFNRHVQHLRFDDQGYKQHWQRFMRNLVALPHLGALRKDLLLRIKQEHLRHWPADRLPDQGTTGLQLAW